MRHPNGYNPLRWNCEKSGCYNVKCRPKIEQFAGCFPGRIAMSDVDGIVEINGRFLLLEWKDSRVGTNLPTGQRIMFERMTRDGQFSVAVVWGDAETMEVQLFSIFWRGVQSKVNAASLYDVQVSFGSWARWAEGKQAAA